MIFRNIDMSKFQPKPGQMDYSKARWAPVINCVVKYKDKILLVQRSNDLEFYPGYWSTIDGFLDDNRSLDEKVKEELKEELGIGENDIVSIRLGEIFHVDEPKYRKTWIVHPVLAEVKSDKVKLDWEAKGYKWVTPNEAKNFKLLPRVDEVIGKFLNEKENER